MNCAYIALYHALHTCLLRNFSMMEISTLTEKNVSQVIAGQVVARLGHSKVNVKWAELV